MIISHKHKFIFIKNRKVAGTSVEMALAPLCGPDDVLSSDTPERARVISPNDELAAHARNFEGGFNVLSELVHDFSPTSVLRVLRDRVQRHRFYNHMRASSVRARVGHEIWNSYYTFCFERNPWDKMVSFYYWYNRSKAAPMDINSFICEPKKGLTADQRYPIDWTRYTLGGRVIVDDVFDYASLSDNLQLALSRAGVALGEIEALEIPHFKAKARPADAQRLNTASDTVIRDVFANEIQTFGYKAPEGLVQR